MLKRNASQAEETTQEWLELELSASPCRSTTTAHSSAVDASGMQPCSITLPGLRIPEWILVEEYMNQSI